MRQFFYCIICKHKYNNLCLIFLENEEFHQQNQVNSYRINSTIFMNFNFDIHEDWTSILIFMNFNFNIHEDWTSILIFMNINFNIHEDWASILIFMNIDSSMKYP